MDNSDGDRITKLRKLNKHSDYILWRRRTYAYIRREDTELLGLSDLPEGASAALRRRSTESSTKAKSTNILCLGESPLQQTREIVDDDDQSTKALWDELKKIDTTSNTQTILNIRNELDSLRYKDREDWDSHVCKFLGIISKLATYDDEVPEAEKVTKLVRTLPESMSTVARMSYVNDFYFERLVNMVSAEISRRENQHPTLPSPGTKPTAAHFSRYGPGAHGKRGRGYRGKNGVHGGRITRHRQPKQQRHGNCFVCGKPGHFASECYHRQTRGEPRWIWKRQGLSSE